MFRSGHAVCRSPPSEVWKIALAASTTSHPENARKSRLRLHMGTSLNLSAQCHGINMNIGG